MEDAKLGNDTVFRTVIVDEAARSNPLDILIPMALAERRIILVGDHRQLPHILEPDIESIKQPRFDTNPEFDSGVFDMKFDFFLAYSIWTHASKPQIETMLDNFLRDSNPGGVFLTSILPAVWPRRDYRGKGWFGTSHESDQPGCIRHSLKWIAGECRLRGLRVRRLGRERDGQTWLQISRDPGTRLLFRTIWSEWFVIRVLRRLFDTVRGRRRT